MNIRTPFLLLAATLTLTANIFASSDQFAGRINRPRSSEPAHKENPSGLSKDVWSPNGYASADSVTSSIGYSMLKWSLGISVAALILALAFSAKSGSQNTHSHSHSH